MSDAADRDPAEVFRGATAAVVANDLDTAMSFLNDDVILDWSRSRGPMQGLHQGKAGARNFWEHMLEAWRPVAWEVEVLARPDPGTAVLDSRPMARGRSSGIELQGHGAMIVRLRDGKLSSITLFQSPAEALEAAGEG